MARAPGRRARGVGHVRVVAEHSGARSRRLRRRRRQGVAARRRSATTSPTRPTLRLARTSNFVSAARPVVADAVSAAIETPPVKAAIHDFAQRAHEQVFQARGARRIDVDSAGGGRHGPQRAADHQPLARRRSCPPTCSMRPPRSRSRAPSTSCSAPAGGSEDLYLPVFLAGVALLVVVMVKARDRIQAIRVVGVVLAVAGALLLGVGVASPALSSAAGTNDPLRGDAVAAFIEVLVGRLVGAGLLFVAVGLLARPRPGPRRRRPPPPGGAGAGVDRGEAHPAALALRRRPRAHGARAVRDHRSRRRCSARSWSWRPCSSSTWAS